MKKLFTLLAVIALAITLASCVEKNKELYKVTDHFVTELSTTYEHYDIFGHYSTYTEGGEYQVTPIVRLIVVRIEKNPTDKKYNDLVKTLKKHYKNDARVNDVYRNQGGTVVIDCRHKY